MPGQEQSLDVHIGATLDWLLRAQAATADAGVAESYHALTRRWRSSYPETTGYIICSLLRAADAGYDKDGRLIAAARRMGLWLVEQQLESGAFAGGTIAWVDKKPAVFNTGQILKGLSDLAARGLDTDDLRLRQSADRAVAWLIASLDDDGCWRRGISNLTTAAVHAYNIRTAWAMARHAVYFGDEAAMHAAVSNARWVRSIQAADGWYEHMAFDVGMSPLTHTIAYTIQGMLEIGAITKDEQFVESARKAAAAMFALQNSESGALPGQCAPGWVSAGSWTSVTGNAQMAIIGHRLALLLGDDTWADAARRATAFCKRLQEIDHTDPGRRGAVRGSFPGHVGYGRFWYMNWTQKFYLDALLCERGVQIT